MSSAQILLLGAIAGGTIFLGLPLGRMRGLDVRLQAGLCAFATGILLFLLWDVLAHGVRTEWKNARARGRGEGSWGRFVWLAFLLGAGLVAGLVQASSTNGGCAASEARRSSAPGRRRWTETASRSWFETLSPERRLARKSRPELDCTTSVRCWRSASRRPPASQPRPGTHHRLRPAARPKGSASSARWRRARLAELGLPRAARADRRQSRSVGTLVEQAWVSRRCPWSSSPSRRARSSTSCRSSSASTGATASATFAWIVLAGLLLGFATDFVLEGSRARRVLPRPGPGGG